MNLVPRIIVCPFCPCHLLRWSLYEQETTVHRLVEITSMEMSTSSLTRPHFPGNVAPSSVIFSGILCFLRVNVQDRLVRYIRSVSFPGWKSREAMVRVSPCAYGMTMILRQVGRYHPLPPKGCFVLVFAFPHRVSLACLVSFFFLSVPSSGRCELCHTKFRFDPQYAENTPHRLPTYEVILGLSSRFVAKWLPLALRIALAIACWLMIAPFLTACLYHGWMHRPSSILTRYSTTDEQEGRQQRQPKDLIASDIVSGAIIAAFVIIGFLSIMSFADFLRAHWQNQQQQQHPVGAANANVVGAQAGRAAQQRRRNGRNNNINNLENNNNINGDEVEEADEGQVDEIVMDRVKEHRCRVSDPDNVDDERQPEHHFDDTAVTGDQSGSADGVGHEARGAAGEIEVDRPRLWNDRNEEMDDDDLDSDYSPEDESSSDEDDEHIFDEEDFHAEDEPAIPGPPPAGNGGLGANPPFDPLDPIFQDDQAVRATL